MNKHNERAELTPEFLADRVPQTATILELEDGTRKTCMTYLELKQFAAMLEAQPAEQAKGQEAKSEQGWPFTGCSGPLTDCDMK